MEDKKKLYSEELKSDALTDEQANDAAGGISFFNDYVCEGCKRSCSGRSYIIGSKRFCANCYNKYNNVNDIEVPQRPEL